jgi:putative flippase GtrA
MTAVGPRAESYAQSGEVFRFAVVGGGATLLYCVLTASFDRISGALAASSVAAYIVSGALSFIGHRAFTFASRGPLASEAARFALLNLAGLAAALAAPFVMTDRLGLAPAYATITTCIIAPPINYLAMRGLVFYRWRLSAGRS